MEKQEKTLRVGYVAPMSISAVNGGVRTQAKKTIEEIQNFGIKPVPLSPWKSIENENLDLVHIFSASIENMGIAKNLKSQNIPFVLSPVFYSNKNSSFIKSALRIEHLISLLGSGIHSDYSVKAEMCKMANAILPNTSEEAQLAERSFSILPDKIKVIPNGVEMKFANAKPDLFHSTYNLRDFVLFAGQAGAPRKNVIRLLEIAHKIDVPVVIIGDFYADDYGDRCRILAEKSDNVFLIETLDHNSEMLASAYAACKVFVLPSLFETPGIAAIEAALSKANIVITENGGTKEYFQNEAEYIEPASRDSLLNAISVSLNKEKTDRLKNHIMTNYSWEIVAGKTAEVYKSILS